MSGLGSKRLPSVNIATLIWPEASNAQNSMATVSPDAGAV